MHVSEQNLACLLFLVVGFCIVALSAGESTTCLIVYKEGGAPAVFRSPKCPRWKFSNRDSIPRSQRCELAMMRGRRQSQEDRALCVLDIPIPFPGKEGLQEVMVGLAAVFDGHNGVEASEMAASLFLEYFAVHTYFLLDAAFSFVSKKYGGLLFERDEKDVSKFFNWNRNIELGAERRKFSIPEKIDEHFPLEILKEALLRTIHDIDATFSKEALRNNLNAGTTATVVLMANRHILVANIGDSKAILCSEKFLPPSDAKATFLRLYLKLKRSGAILRRSDYPKKKSSSSNGFIHLVVEELTSDHHPDRDDERSRVEASGGYIAQWDGRPRVNGELAVSRAIGDINYKRYGVISTPEIIGWKPLASNDSYLVVATDGVFENLSVQDVCDNLATEVLNYEKSEFSSSCSASLAECLARTAYDEGTMDNVAIVVVPLRDAGTISPVPPDEDADINGMADYLYEGKSRTAINKLGLKYEDQITSKLNTFLVKRDSGMLGCFYLSDNLNEKVGPLRIGANQSFITEELTTVLLESKSNHSSGSIFLYSDLNVCIQYEFFGEKLESQCINKEGFSTFLGLLESVPFHQTGSDYGSTEYELHRNRYKLEKRCGRGSFGEVWLAVHWNCQRNVKVFDGDRHEIFNFDASISNSTANSSFTARKNGLNATLYDGILFILKRIMIEKGSSFYLSGLREKYFGEVFLNASRCHEVFQTDGLLKSNVDAVDLDFCKEYDLYTIGDIFGSSWNFNELIVDRFQKVMFEEGLSHIARFVESFESKNNDVWLVFRHEGISLSKIIYSVEDVIDEAHEKKEETNHYQVLHPSKYWHWLRTTEAGKEEIRYLMWQMLHGLKSCHDRNITHRDIKPENLVICFEDPYTGKCYSEREFAVKNYTLKLRIIDFGSAIDDFTLKHLYGSNGPSSAEQTMEYTPPEAFLNASWYLGSSRRNLKYDMWSVGVVFLELILGSPNVFQISAITRGFLDPHIQGWSDELKELAYKLRSFMELCILTPSVHYRRSTSDKYSPASWKCSEDFFAQQIKNKDPLKLGFPNVQALRLARQLLVWDPDHRLSLEDALNHPYFQPPPNG